MQKYLDKGHHCFMDNFYTSFTLAEYFKNMAHMLLEQLGTTESIFQLN